MQFLNRWVDNLKVFYTHEGWKVVSMATACIRTKSTIFMCFDLKFKKNWILDEIL